VISNVAWQCPDNASAALVLAHGAGAGMAHPSMRAIAQAFGQHGIATLRFDFPFMAAGRRRVDRPAVATACIAEAFARARALTELPLWLGGHSFGGRMASHAVLEQDLDAEGLILCSFPLHPAGKPSVARARHLPEVRRPMLFLSGTRDRLADRALLEDVVSGLPAAEVHWLDSADHGYRVSKSRRTPQGVFDEMATVARRFIDEHGSRSHA
jgi:predicted alpha/beta-hydrolase family hydrolase